MDENTQNNLRQKGFDLIKENEHLKALEIFSKLVNVSQNHNDWYLLGICERFQNNFNEAIEYYWKAIELYKSQNSDLNDTDSLLINYRHSLAIAYQQSKDYQSAIDIFLDIYRSVPDDFKNLNSLAYTIHLNAISLFNKDSNFSNFLNPLALHFYEQADLVNENNFASFCLELKKEKFSQKIKNGEEWVDEYYTLCNNARSLNPDYSLIKSNIANMYLDMGYIDDAINICNKTLSRIDKSNIWYDKLVYILDDAKSRK